MRFLQDDGREHGTDVALAAVYVLHGTAPVELRALPAPGQHGAEHGVYADRNRLGADLARLIDDDDARVAEDAPPGWGGLYISLHELAPHVVVTNTLRGGAGAISAADVVRFNWLDVDIDRADAVRSVSKNATDAERAICLGVASAIADDLGALGAPADSIGIMQGANGAGVLMRVTLPAPGGKRLLEAAVLGLAERHPHPGVMLDVKAATNPAGHIRVPGTVARKAPPMPGRPWHVAWLLRAPDRDCRAPVAVLEQLAAHHCADRQHREHRRPAVPPRRDGQRHAPALVTLGALRRYAAPWGVKREHESGAATVLELERCPYSTHRSPGKAFLSWFASGRWEPGCHSPKCEGLTWRWMVDGFGHPEGR